MTAVVAAVQFRPLPQFRMAEVVAVARAFDEWRVVDVPHALSPIVETQPGEPARQTFNLGIGSPPPRLVLEKDDGRWLTQLQQDRLAVHEQRRGERPSFRHVRPALEDVTTVASGALGRKLLAGDHASELVEVIYENHIAARDGGWSSFADLHRVLRILREAPGTPPYDQIEEIQLAFSELLRHEGRFMGRLRVHANPALDETGGPMLHLRLNSRRFVREGELWETLEACHTDIVQGFTAVTTEEMHTIWGRYQ